MYVYLINCSKKQKTEYQEQTGVYYREDEETGKALFFSTRNFGCVAKCTFSEGRVNTVTVNLLEGQ